MLKVAFFLTGLLMFSQAFGSIYYTNTREQKFPLSFGVSGGSPKKTPCFVGTVVSIQTGTVFRHRVETMTRGLSDGAAYHLTELPVEQKRFNATKLSDFGETTWKKSKVDFFRICGQETIVAETQGFFFGRFQTISGKEATDKKVDLIFDDPKNPDASLRFFNALTNNLETVKGSGTLFNVEFKKLEKCTVFPSYTYRECIDIFEIEAKDHVGKAETGSIAVETTPTSEILSHLGLK